MNTARLFPWLLLSSLAFAACGDDETSNDGEESVMDDDDSDDDDDSGNDDSGNDDSGNDDSGNDDSGNDDSGNDDSGNDDSGNDDSGANSCDGDWYLGSVPFTGDSFIEACDDNPPQTCVTGNYIVFGDGDCFCLPDCSRVGLSEGEDCTNDGSVTCAQIENDEGTSSGVFCVPPQWGLCG